MKQTLSKDFLLIIGFFILFVPLMFVSIFRIEYSFTAPGYNKEVEGFIELDTEFSQTGSIHTTSVFVVDKITVLQKILGDLNEKIEVEPFPEIYKDVDLDDLVILGYFQKNESIQNSLIVASQYTNHNIEYITSPTVYLKFNYLEENTLELGDKIITINGFSDYKAELQKNACDAELVFEVDRDGEILFFTVYKKPDHECSVGIFIKDYTEIVTTDLHYRIITTRTGGGSGGLMQTLYIFNKLDAFDITHGLRIAGTGTINIDGIVGSIGGIEQKIYTAFYNDIDIFFVPHHSDGPNDNYIKALEVYKTLDTDMILVPVTTFEDALNFLLIYEGGE